MENSNTQIHFGSQLSSHMKITYTKEKHHNCNLCEKAYFAKGAYDTHLDSHEDKKPHACDGCNKSFENRYVMLTHFQEVHGPNILLQCDICHKKVKKLKAHITHCAALVKNELKPN